MDINLGRRQSITFYNTFYLQRKPIPKFNTSSQLVDRRIKISYTRNLSSILMLHSGLHESLPGFRRNKFLC